MSSPYQVSTPPASSANGTQAARTSPNVVDLMALFRSQSRSASSSMASLPNIDMVLDTCNPDNDLMGTRLETSSSGDNTDHSRPETATAGASTTNLIELSPQLVSASSSVYSRMTNESRKDLSLLIARSAELLRIGDVQAHSDAGSEVGTCEDDESNDTEHELTRFGSMYEYMIEEEEDGELTAGNTYNHMEPQLTLCGGVHEYVVDDAGEVTEAGTERVEASSSSIKTCSDKSIAPKLVRQDAWPHFEEPFTNANQLEQSDSENDPKETIKPKKTKQSKRTRCRKVVKKALRFAVQVMMGRGAIQSEFVGYF
jgi:hypothetical protein